MGQRLRIVSDQSFSAGEHQLNVETYGLPAGAYYIHLTLSGGRRITRRVVKQ
jgi:hypothetical protein